MENLNYLSNVMVVLMIFSGVVAISSQSAACLWRECE